MAGYKIMTKNPIHFWLVHRWVSLSHFEFIMLTSPWPKRCDCPGTMFCPVVGPKISQSWGLPVVGLAWAVSHFVLNIIIYSCGRNGTILIVLFLPRELVAQWECRILNSWYLHCHGPNDAIVLGLCCPVIGQKISRAVAPCDWSYMSRVAFWI